MRPDDMKMSGKAKLIWILLLVGFMIMEFPGILFYKDLSEPYIFGFPFIYSFNLIMWAYMVVVVLFAYLSNWGEPVQGEKNQGGDKQ